MYNKTAEQNVPCSRLGPVVQSVVSLTSSLRVISLTVLADSIYNIQIFLLKKCEKQVTHIFFSKNFQRICVSLSVNFKESLTNDIVSFEQLGPDLYFAVFICTEDTFSLEEADNCKPLFIHDSSCYP